MDVGYLKKVGVFVLSVILSAAVLFYFGYHIWHSFTKEILTEPTVNITHEHTLSSEGYVFRTETVIQSSGGVNSVIPTVKEGEHIRKNGEVAKMYSEFAPDTVARIAEIENQIELLRQYEQAGNMSLKDSSNIDRQIYSVLSEMRGYGDAGAAGDAVSLRQTLLSEVGERTMLMGGISDLAGRIAALEGEKNSLSSSLGAYLGTVYTPVSGFYYSEVDGYENVFTAEVLEDITLRELRTVLTSEAEAVEGAGKTVTKSRWYLVCMIDASEKNTYKVGGTCKVKFRNTELSVDMDVEQVLYDSEGTAVIFSTNIMPEGFDFSRKQDVELVKEVYTGLRVPVSAVRLVNGETGVYILDTSVVTFRRIEILYTTDDAYIVKLPPKEFSQEEADEAERGETPRLKFNDSIIMEGKGLYEGRVIGDR